MALPRLAVLGDPLLDLAHRRRFEVARAHSTDLLGADDAALLQHFDVLGYVVIGTTLMSLVLMYFIQRAVLQPPGT